MQLIIFQFSALITKNQLTIPQGSPDNALATGLRIVFALAGAISILMITIAGLTMVVSQGNPDTVNKSRNAVIYAAIGLAVCVMGYSIVTFVINKL